MGITRRKVLFTFSMRFVVLVLVIFVLCVCLFKRNSTENMAYLDQYETQDNYRNVPESWPVPYTSTTALYAAKRKYLYDLFRNEGCGCGW